MGRHPYPRDEHGNIVRPGDERYDQLRAEQSRGSDGNPRRSTRAASDTGSRIIRDARGRFGGSAKRGDTSGIPEESEGVHIRQETPASGDTDANIHVEPPAPRPPKGEPGGPGKRRTSGAFKPDHVTNMVCAGFGVLAVGLNRPYWGVEDKKTEVEPWAPAGAELLNKYVPDGAAAEKLLDGFAAGQVVLGLSVMIGKRIAVDRQIAQAIARDRLAEQRARVDELREQEGLPPAPAEPQSQNGHVAAQYGDGSGAAPVGPTKNRNVGGDFTPGL